MEFQTQASLRTVKITSPVSLNFSLPLSSLLPFPNPRAPSFSCFFMRSRSTHLGNISGFWNCQKAVRGMPPTRPLDATVFLRNMPGELLRLQLPRADPLSRTQSCKTEAWNEQTTGCSGLQQELGNPSFPFSLPLPPQSFCADSHCVSGRLC